MKTKNLSQRLGIWAVIVAGILMVPYLTNAPWSKEDFISAGTILFALAVFYEFATRNMKGLKPRLLIGLGILVIIVFIVGWAATGPD